jgi:hypothetical protein
MLGFIREADSEEKYAAAPWVTVRRSAAIGRRNRQRVFNRSRARIVTWEYGFGEPKYGARGGGFAILLRRFQAGYVRPRTGTLQGLERRLSM